MEKDEIWEWANQKAPATEIKAGVTLITKNGRQVGNAIIVKELVAPAVTFEYLEKTNQKMFLVETDFGNQMKLVTNEINDWWTLGFEQDYDDWFDQRLEKIKATLG